MPPKPPAARTKLIVRNLPPSLAEDAALDALHTIIPSTSYNYVAFIPGKMSSSAMRPARLYINLCNPSDVVRVASALHNKLFVSERGAQFRATVEFAPNQRIPRPVKPDKRPGTLETDADYVAFCEQRNAKPTAQPSDAPGAPSPDEGPVITPLMQALIAKHTSAPKTRSGGKKGTAPSKAGPSGAPPKTSKATQPPKATTAQSNRPAAKKASKEKASKATTQEGPPKVVVAVRQNPPASHQGQQASSSAGGSSAARGGRTAAAAPHPTASQPTSSASKGGGRAAKAPSVTKTTPALPSEEPQQRGSRRVREGFQVYRPKPRSSTD